jgi:hypothetical protein
VPEVLPEGLALAAQKKLGEEMLKRITQTLRESRGYILPRSSSKR